MAFIAGCDTPNERGQIFSLRYAAAMSDRERTPQQPSTPSEGTVQGGCIVTRLRQTRADMLGTSDEQHYWDCHDAAAEIERLRSEPCPYVTGTVTRYCTLTPLTLTDEEREAIRFAAFLYEHGGREADAATLRGLLERTK